jgi:hypothetical protein
LHRSGLDHRSQIPLRAEVAASSKGQPLPAFQTIPRNMILSQSTPRPNPSSVAGPLHPLHPYEQTQFMYRPPQDPVPRIQRAPLPSPSPFPSEKRSAVPIAAGFGSAFLTATRACLLVHERPSKPSVQLNHHSDTTARSREGEEVFRPCGGWLWIRLPSLRHVNVLKTGMACSARRLPLAQEPPQRLPLRYAGPRRPAQTRPAPDVAPCSAYTDACPRYPAFLDCSTARSIPPPLRRPIPTSALSTAPRLHAHYPWTFSSLVAVSTVAD